MHKLFHSSLLGFALLVPSLAFEACDDYMDNATWQVDATQQLDEYIDANPDLSLFGDLINQGDVKGMVHAYGTYTLFVPTNEAVQNFFGTNSIAETQTKISQLSADSARFMVKYHMLSDTLYTTDFENSRLSCANMDADYLTSKYLFEGGNNYYVINRNAQIVTPDVRTGNGILHVVNGFLSRPAYTVRDIFNNPDSVAEGYSALPKLMNYIASIDSLHVNLDQIIQGSTTYTFLAQSDEVMSALGMNPNDSESSVETAFASLMDRLRGNNIKSYSDSTLLQNWIGYHFVKGRYYLSDIRSSSSMATCTSLGKVVTISTLDDNIFLNRFESFDEPGIQMSTEGDFVDFTCANGVIQTIKDELEIIERAATRINWDLGEQPEIMALKGFRKAGTKQYFYSSLTADETGYVPTDISTISFTGKNSPVVLYECDYEPELGSLNFDVKSEYVYGDYLNFRLATHVMQYIELKTPTLVTGKYKVWLRYRAMGTFANGHGTIRTTFKQDGQDDQVFGTVTLSAYGPKSNNSDDDEAQIAKGAIEPQAFYPNQNYVAGVLLGTIDVLSDGVHTIRWDATEGNQSLGQNYDMLMFIPIDNDQLLPRVCIDGSDSRVYKIVVDDDGNLTTDKTVYRDISGFNGDYRTHIFPNQCQVVSGALAPGECPYSWCPNHDASKFEETEE